MNTLTKKERARIEEELLDLAVEYGKIERDLFNAQMSVGLLERKKIEVLGSMRTHSQALLEPQK